MLLLFPPSEGKTPATIGPTLNLKQLPFPELTPQREQVIDSLIALSAKHPRKAAEVLELGPTQQSLLEINQQIRTAHCAPAIHIYSGVLFDHFDYPSLTKKAQDRADQSTLIASALFGFLSPDSLVPAYRLSGSTVIPKLGPLPTLWKPSLASVLDSYADQLILDMRSGTYTKLGPLPRTENCIELKVMTMVNGVRKSVTHFNKATKGDIARAAFTSSAKMPTSIDQLEKYFRSLGFDANLESNKRGVAELIVLTD